MLDGLLDFHLGGVIDDRGDSPQVCRERCLKEALHVEVALGFLLHVRLPGTENILFQGTDYFLF